MSDNGVQANNRLTGNKNTSLSGSNRTPIYYLSIGSNMDPEKNIPAGLKLLKEKFAVKKISSVYETDPVGPTGQPLFWNLAAAIETDQDQETVAKSLAAIEKALGRTRNPSNKYAPRTIDLDLLPQQGYQTQAFIMVPLAEIAPMEKDPQTGKSYEEIARGFKQLTSIKFLRGRSAKI